MRYREQNRNTHHIINSVLHLDNESTGIEVGSSSWFDWLELQFPFYYADGHGTFHARPEQRRNGWYWYAYSRKNGKLHKRYMGKAEKLTNRHLGLICKRLDRA